MMADYVHRYKTAADNQTSHEKEEKRRGRKRKKKKVEEEKRRKKEREMKKKSTLAHPVAGWAWDGSPLPILWVLSDES